MNWRRQTARRRRKTRKGISLGELLIVMSAAMAVLTISTALMHRILHAHSKARSFVDAERTSLRLANTFRSDVHQAKSAATTDAPSDEGKFLQLELPDGQRVEYRRGEHTISRMLLEGERTISRETFVFQSGIELAVRNDGSRLVVLSINARPGELPTGDRTSQASSYVVPVNLHVEAALHRNPALTPEMRGGAR